MAEFTGPALVAVGLPGDIDATPRNPLGTIQRLADGKEYIYLRGVASTVASDWVSYDEAFLTARMVTSSAPSILGPVAVASAAIVANRYGWYQISGAVLANAGDVADNAKVYATSTAGRCDDAAVAGAQVMGAVWRGEDATDLALVQLNRPWIGMTDAT